MEYHELEKVRKIAVQKTKQVADQQAKQDGFIPDLQTTTTSKLVFNSKADQHAYAKSIVAKGGMGTMSHSSGGTGNRGHGATTNTSADNTTDSKSSYPKKKLYGTEAEAARKRELDDRYR
mmetsp:Transcript_2008/g.2201  ORF Transcript_2008/g.2201 Transcript_2008/m.2201 type:complete len:120 (-) Transcript_2008:25-384(-)